MAKLNDHVYNVEHISVELEMALRVLDLVLDNMAGFIPDHDNVEKCYEKQFNTCEAALNLAQRELVRLSKELDVEVAGLYDIIKDAKGVA